MTSDVHGISRLVGATRAAEPAAATPAGATGFVTTVQRANDIAPFETVVKRAAAEQEARASQPGAAPTASGPLATPAMSPAAKAAKAQKSFEAFALQTFIGSMLPKENSKMFGTGNAGKMWQSLLAEKLADQITASGRLKLLPQQQSGTTAASATTGTPDVTGPASATAAQEGIKRLDAAGGMTQAALQQIVGSLKPGRSGGAR
jgi:Rod binding domain-containing protein